MTDIFRYFSIFFLGIAAPLLSYNISVIGIGHLGLSYALCLENAGHTVLGVDVRPEYVKQVNKKALWVGNRESMKCFKRAEIFKRLLL